MAKQCSVCCNTKGTGNRQGAGYYYTKKQRLINMDHINVVKIRIYLLHCYFTSGHKSEAIVDLVNRFLH